MHFADFYHVHDHYLLATGHKVEGCSRLGLEEPHSRKLGADWEDYLRKLQQNLRSSLASRTLHGRFRYFYVLSQLA